ncbi:uncharacterized protein EV422DRAFT_504071 [Fimicolochytrium jonesii]|uniref:uncharacterized protein n=1 Tax=Fimicolochytrium jonesii TaxID=1396493 RepID=UPI0022FE9C48|nr:uncharacterized protein EV422DRAFT_504071 [Fimicolochytrium jonesii]KAI8823997.1 hypothetical protein EV422DRAFT_504071 [Fimicolochytrium jonesii]
MVAEYQPHGYAGAHKDSVVGGAEAIFELNRILSITTCCPIPFDPPVGANDTSHAQSELQPHLFQDVAKEYNLRIEVKVTKTTSIADFRLLITTVYDRILRWHTTRQSMSLSTTLNINLVNVQHGGHLASSRRKPICILCRVL